MSNPNNPSLKQSNTKPRIGIIRQLWNRLTDPADSVKTIEGQRQARLLATLLIPFMMLASFGIIGPWLTGYDLSKNPFYSLMGFMIAILIVAYGFSRGPRYKVGSFLVIIAVTLFPYAVLIAAGNFDFGATFAALVWSVLSILLASLLISLGGVIVLALVNIIIILGLPLLIAELAFSSVFGPFGFVISLSGLIIAFSYYRNQLENERQHKIIEANRDLQAIRLSLEERIKDRTRDLALAAEVGQSISRIRDLDPLLAEAVEIILTRFGLYHAQIYLLDQKGKYLKLRAGTGEIGENLVKQNHRLLVGSGSINGLAAAKKKPVLVSNTMISPLFHPNPLLPDTRSELAIPLIVADRLVGVLDLQSASPNSFSDDSLPGFKTLASQLAIAIENANLFSRTMAIQAELEDRITWQAGSDWDRFLDGINRHERFGFIYDQYQTKPLAEILPVRVDEHVLNTPISISDKTIGKIQIEPDPDKNLTPDEIEMVASIANQVAQKVDNLRLLAEAEQYRREAEEAARRLVRQGWEDYKTSAGSSSLGFVYNQNKVLPIAGPIKGDTPLAFSQVLMVGGEPIGKLDIVGNDKIETDAMELVTVVANRLSEHIEKLRLAKQTEKALAATQGQAQRLVLLNELGAALNSAHDEGEIYRLVGKYTPDILGGDYLGVALLDLDGESVELFNLDSQKGLVPTKIHLPTMGTAVGTAIDENRLIRLSGNGSVNDYTDARKLAKQGLVSTMNAPLATGGLAVGALIIGSKKAEAYDESSENVMQQIAVSLASITENRRLFDQIQTRAAARAALNEVNHAIISQSDPDSVYKVVVESLVRRFEISFASIWILDGAKDDLLFRVSAGDYAHPDGLGGRIPLNSKRMLARIAKGRRPIVNNDLTNNSRIEDNEWVKEHGFVSFAGYPLLAGDGLLGVLSMFSQEPMVEQKVPLLQSLAVQAGTVVNTLQLIQQTQKRAAELETVARVSAATSTTLETERLLQEVVELTKSSFNLYHVHTYLLDEDEIDLVLTAGSGEIGQKMVTEGHTISLRQERSLVARAARTRQIVMVNDVYSDPGFLPNPLLPETRSEMAIPLIAGDTVLGVLDVQAVEPNRFTNEDVHVQKTLAAQVAVALQNAQMFEATQQASFLLGERVKELNCLNDIGRKMEETPSVPDFLEWVAQRIPPAMQYPNECIVAITLNDHVFGNPDAMEQPAHAIEGLRIAGKYVGRIYVAYTQERDFSNDESMLLGGIGHRVSNYIESRYLFQQTQQQLSDLAIIQETTSTLTTVLTFDEAITTMLTQIAKAVNADDVSLFLPDAEQQVIHVDSYPPANGEENTQRFEGISSAQYCLMKKGIEMGQPYALTVKDSNLQPRVRKAFKKAGVIANAQIPLMALDDVFGMLSVSSCQPERVFTEKEVGLLQTLADQAMIAIQRVRLLDETRRKARHEQILREITARVSNSADVETVMRTAVEQVGRALGRRAFVYLERDKTLQESRTMNGA